MREMKILVIDGQGGGLGKNLVECLRKKLPSAEILAMGTNGIATSGMLKAGATNGATGENAICYTCGKLTEEDVIVGPIGIVMANAMLGELTPAMAEAVASSSAQRVLVPVNRCRTHVAGGTGLSMEAAIGEAVGIIVRILEEKD
jgi:hypothetical protein